MLLELITGQRAFDLARLANDDDVMLLDWEENGRPLPKFGDWDVNDPASAEGFTVIFNKARDEKKTGGKADSPSNADPGLKQAAAPVKKPPPVSGPLVSTMRLKMKKHGLGTFEPVFRVALLFDPAFVCLFYRVSTNDVLLFMSHCKKKWFCCMQGPHAES